MDAVLTIILSIVGGGSLTMFIQYLINRHDSRKGELAQIKEEIRKLREDMQEDQVTTARVRILGFSDEMRHGVQHSKESFDQALQDIDKYKKYCNTHPSYENARASAAIAHINEAYRQCLLEDSFLV